MLKGNNLELVPGHVQNPVTEAVARLKRATISGKLRTNFPSTVVLGQHDCLLLKRLLALYKGRALDADFDFFKDFDIFFHSILMCKLRRCG